jgi:hypothetical protein
MLAWLNISTKRVGGLRFFKFGRLNISFSVSATYKPFDAPKPGTSPVGQFGEWTTEGFERMLEFQAVRAVDNAFSGQAGADFYWQLA